MQKDLKHDNNSNTSLSNNSAVGDPLLTLDDARKLDNCFKLEGIADGHLPSKRTLVANNALQPFLLGQGRAGHFAIIAPVLQTQEVILKEAKSLAFYPLLAQQQAHLLITHGQGSLIVYNYFERASNVLLNCLDARSRLVKSLCFTDVVAKLPRQANSFNHLNTRCKKKLEQQFKVNNIAAEGDYLCSGLGTTVFYIQNGFAALQIESYKSDIKSGTLDLLLFNDALLSDFLFIKSDYHLYLFNWRTYRCITIKNYFKKAIPYIEKMIFRSTKQVDIVYNVDVERQLVRTDFIRLLLPNLFYQFINQSIEGLAAV